MTIKELRELLEQYPGDAKVFVVQERKPGKFAGKMMDVELSWTIDQDTAEGSLCLYPKIRMNRSVDY